MFTFNRTQHSAKTLLPMQAALVSALVISAFSIPSGSAYAMEIASGNPVCSSIKAEGGSCAGGLSTEAGGKIAAQDPVIKTKPKDFPRFKNSGLVTAETTAFSATEKYPGERAGRAKPTHKNCVKNPKGVVVCSIAD